ncbi:MAG: hypothetical protein RH917_04095 [Lacipirellulaceae bacterium]
MSAISNNCRDFEPSNFIDEPFRKEERRRLGAADTDLSWWQEAAIVAINRAVLSFNRYIGS